MADALRRWWWLSARQRHGAVVLAGVYALGWALGRLSGKVEVLERVSAAGARDS